MCNTLLNVIDINSPLDVDEFTNCLLNIPKKSIVTPPYTDINPYGEGNTTKKLIDIILNTNIDNLLMQKQITK